jgi:hypothetical protein
MAEKKGSTVKLIYDFPTQLSTEVFDKGAWSRVTCKYFRSFNGPRRIMKFNKQNESYYEEYNGPVFLFETNIKLKDMNKIGYVYPYDVIPKSKLRPSENSYLEDPRIKEFEYL